jgi:predicted ArsR family transcriptional regulator
VDGGEGTDEDVLRRQAHALGDATRFRVFQLVAEAGDTVAVSELASEMRVHHTVVRQHLAVLRDAGLLLESTERAARRGRPRLVYRTSVDAATRWAGPGPYEQLSLMLLRVLLEGAPPREVGREAGRAAATRVSARRGTEAAVVRELARLGFDPLVLEEADGVVVQLRHCPMASAAESSPEIVCELHHGIVEGMAEAMGDDDVTSFTPADARAGTCQVTLRRRGGAPE